MQLQGPVRFTRRVDVPTLETFLRAQGMSEKHIDTLTIRFMHEIPPPLVTMLKIFPRPWGRCDLLRNRILLATYYVEEAEDRQKALQTMNTVLLHEAGHACKLFLSLFHLCSPVFLGSLLLFTGVWAVDKIDHAIAGSGELIFRVVGGLLIVSFPLLWARVSYRFAPGEKRARRFEHAGITVIRSGQVQPLYCTEEKQ
jgi:hypothetical protein